MSDDIEDRLSDNTLKGSEASDDEQSSGEIKSDDASNLSALRENISKKGKNSYYYAHSGKINGPEWDGKEEPRKLGEGSALPPVTPVVVYSSITEYSWLDEENYVKIYIDHSDADKLDDTNIFLTSGLTSFEFRFIADEKNYSLTIPATYDAIDEMTYQKKASKFIVKLKKQSKIKWPSLKRTT